MPDMACMAKEKLEAAVLGYLVRKHLVHSVREEFAKVVGELEAGCNLSKDHHLCLEWPRERVLSFPVFRETGSSRDMHKEPDLISDGSRPALPTIHELTKETSAAVTKEQSATDISSPPPSTSTMPTVLKAEGSCGPQETPQSDSESPSTTSHQLGQMQPSNTTAQTLLSSTVDTSTVGELANATGMEPGLETLQQSGMEAAAPESYSQLLDSVGPVQAELPRDRESLLELRTQMAMELVWIKQAIASRQKYLQLRRKMKDGRE